MPTSLPDGSTTPARTTRTYFLYALLLVAIVSAGIVHAFTPRQPVPVAATEPLNRHPNAEAAVRYALHQLGTPYVWGGTGDGGFDCSGLVMRAWQAGGVQLPRTTRQMINVGRRITRAQLARGDLVFTNNGGHVQLYIGHGRIVEAPHTGAVVRTGRLPRVVTAYTRVSDG
ncbi:C40 family peptidase [Planosporangium thailandense]|nr:C40 family peptidase [Planosporangium thailandense]